MDVSNSGLVVFALLTALTFPGLSWGDDSASAPEELTPCEKMMAKCRDNWGECFDRHAYNGDACCQQGASFKCVDDMTEQEKMSKDPGYAKLINCAMAGHPDWESFEKCLPDPSECKRPRLCQWDEEEMAKIKKCPRKFKCLLRKHSDIAALKRCAPNNDDYNFENCNAPMPPIENTTEAA
uniref:Uncharacterized protein n=1 Tax=Globodera rostochiensis TaxID=31243 RepID=A0A914I974_GLORO